MSTLSYAFYRLPYADTYTLMESEQAPIILESLDMLGDIPGFVLVPFSRSADTPALLIQPDSTTTRRLTPSIVQTSDSDLQSSTIPSQQYVSAFEAFHGAVESGECLKLVLARNKKMTMRVPQNLNDPMSMRILFERACHLYPRLMVMLFSTPLSGTWLIASPEILLDGKGRSLHTVALAGTMPFQEGHLDWSEKNKQEQHVVEEYIENILANASPDVLKDGPVTMRAGNLVHLRSDFRFHLAQGLTLGKLIQQLHPTPAVCGMPKFEATNFISEHEGLDRRYYSGFAGPVDIQGETHLYVSLRCAELSSSENGTDAVLYAGGGIMPGSECQSEWIETESKMKTIQNVLQ